MLWIGGLAVSALVGYIFKEIMKVTNGNVITDAKNYLAGKFKSVSKIPLESSIGKTLYNFIVINSYLMKRFIKDSLVFEFKNTKSMIDGLKDSLINSIDLPTAQLIKKRLDRRLSSKESKPLNIKEMALLPIWLGNDGNDTMYPKNQKASKIVGFLYYVNDSWYVVLDKEILKKDDDYFINNGFFSNTNNIKIFKKGIQSFKNLKSNSPKFIKGTIEKALEQAETIRLKREENLKNMKVLSSVDEKEVHLSFKSGNKINK